MKRAPLRERRLLVRSLSADEVRIGNTDDRDDGPFELSDEDAPSGEQGSSVGRRDVCTR